MKIKRYVTAALLAAISVLSYSKTLTVSVRVDNPSGMAKASEPVVVKLKDVKKLDFDVLSATVKAGGRDVASQLDDMDGDFVNDELFFLADIGAGETVTYDVELSDEAVGTSAVPRVYTAFQLRDKKDLYPDVLKVEAPGSTNVFNDIYMHGITVESELAGYRIYFDERQNVDLYGKKKRRLELAETQFYTTAEQLAQGYGTDVLWAGKAIGCGSFKMVRNQQPSNWDCVKVRGQRVVTTGALRTVVEVYDLGIPVSEVPGAVAKQGARFDVHQYYSLYAGHRDLQVDVQFSKNLKGGVFCTGVQKVGVTADEKTRMGHKSKGVIRKNGIAASWGCDYPDMGKKQLWAPEPIGLAVYVPKKYVEGSNEDDLNYVYFVSPDKSGQLHYWLSFCANKEEGGYHSSNEWFDSLDAWKDGVSQPVKVTVK